VGRDGCEAHGADTHQPKVPASAYTRPPLHYSNASDVQKVTRWCDGAGVDTLRRSVAVRPTRPTSAGKTPRRSGDIRPRSPTRASPLVVLGARRGRSPLPARCHGAARALGVSPCAVCRGNSRARGPCGRYRRGRRTIIATPWPYRASPYGGSSRTTAAKAFGRRKRMSGDDLLLGKRIERLVCPDLPAHERPGNARFRTSPSIGDYSACIPATLARPPLLRVTPQRPRRSTP